MEDFTNKRIGEQNKNNNGLIMTIIDYRNNCELHQL